MLKVEVLTFGPFQENTALIFDEAGHCAIVDPGCMSASEQMHLSAFIQNNGLKPVLLLNTHCHVDHIAGNRYVADTYGLQLHIHPEDEKILAMQEQVCKMYGLPCDHSPKPGIYLHDGDRIKIGNDELEVIFTPGHAPGHVVFYSEKDGFVVNGDVLFNGSIGRTDLPFGDFDTLIRSIKTRMFALPDSTVVYCGHGPETSIGREKQFNPFLQ